ncbi:hypothetical protein ABE42_08160, partial [Bacillus thuringiensis]|nr:hypothetical protein [Bacillus thuringiensis]
AAVNEIFISDFPIISAQLNIYQRFFKYIDLPTKKRQMTGLDNKKRVLQNKTWSTFFYYPNSAYFPASIFSNAAATCSSVNS